MVYCRKNSKSDFKNLLSVRGGVRGVQKFYSISWRFRPFWKIDQKNVLSQILTKIDRHFWMPYLVNFLRFFTVLPWKIKVKRVYFTVYRFWKKLTCLGKILIYKYLATTFYGTLQGIFPTVQNGIFVTNFLICWYPRRY